MQKKTYNAAKLRKGFSYKASTLCEVFKTNAPKIYRAINKKQKPPISSDKKRIYTPIVKRLFEENDKILVIGI